jgi:hypothetical protein
MQHANAAPTTTRARQSPGLWPACACHGTQLTRATADDWVEHASLNATGVSIILHVAIRRRWPFAANPNHPMAATAHGGGAVLNCRIGERTTRADRTSGLSHRELIEAPATELGVVIL